MPEGVEMPAPLNTTPCLLPRMISAALRTPDRIDDKP
jgi:hypothetical protein